MASLQSARIYDGGSYTWIIITTFALCILHLASTSDSIISAQKITNFSLPSSENQLVTISDASVAAQGSVATLNHQGEANNSQTSGRALFPKQVQLRSSGGAVASFDTSFTFSIETTKNNAGAHGMAFIVVPDETQVGDTDKYMGILTATTNNRPQNHVFAVEIDNWMNEEFGDPSYSHIGVNINSMNSSHTLDLCSSDSPGCRFFINSGNFTLSISYDGTHKTLSVSLDSNEAGSTAMPTIEGLDLYDIFEDFMYVGFSGSTGGYVEKHTIHTWSFISTLSFTNSTLTSIGAPRKRKSSAAIIAIAIVLPVAVCSLIIVGGIMLRLRRQKELQLNVEYDSEKDLKLNPLYEQFHLGARRFTYEELRVATRDFSPEEELGRGAFGIVYRGTLPDNDTLVAVKHMKEGSRQGELDFLAELSIISRVRHRNLLHLRGWCRTKQGKLLLVYDYMPNGSLEKLLHAKQPRGGAIALLWETRYKIMKGVAAALVYLHEEWEECIIHRDVKSSNVLLDANYIAHLGDFGLARLMDHDKTGKLTQPAGTPGYIAPELAITQKATTMSDVYSFGIIALEVGSGRKTWELPEAVWDAYKENELVSVADENLRSEFDGEEMVTLLRVGLLCSQPNASDRPTMRHVTQILAGEAVVPALPQN